MVHTWSRVLGSKGIMCLDIHFKEMYKVSRYYETTAPRPLIIVLITGPDAFQQFVEATQTFKMSFPAWLVVFLRLSTKQVHNYCHDPPGNPFSLAFNANMLVLCYGDNILREWYSVDGNNTEIYDLAVWNSDKKKFRLLTNLNLFERRRNFKGMLFRGVVVKDAPFLTINNGTYDGLFGRLMQELTQALNFTIEIVNFSSQFGSYNKTNMKWSGALNELIMGRADIAVSGFSITSARLDIVDYMTPLIMSKNKIFFKQPEIFGLQWFAYIENFSYRIWLAIVGVMFLSLAVLVLIKWYYLDFPNTATVIFDEFFHVWGVFCQQGLTEVPQCLSLRLAYFTIFVVSLVIFTAYSASLICFLTACVRVLPFRSIEGFIKDDAYDLVVIQGGSEYDLFANSRDPLNAAMMKRLRPYNSLPPTIKEGFRYICEDSKLAFFTSEELAKSFPDYVPCKVSSIDAERSDSASMIVSKDSPYTAALNYHLQKFLVTGVFNRFKNAYQSANFEREITFQPVGMFNVVSLLAIFNGGILLAVMVLFIEICYHSLSSNVKFRNAPASSQFEEITF